MKILPFKRWVFWAHLFAGLLASVVVFIMAFTGVLLTYERQFKELSEMAYTQTVDTGKPVISTDEVVSILRKKHPNEAHIFVRWVNRDGAAIPAWAGEHSYLIHPYTGDVLREGEGIVEEAFHVITDLHRYLLLEGDYKLIGKTITAYSNLIFVFLLVSGVIIWWPKHISMKSLKQQTLLRQQYTNKQHRHRHWHFVFGAWSLPFLLVISMTATLFYFQWANKALYGLYGEEVPAREKKAMPETLDADVVSYDTLFVRAQQHADDNGYQDWYSMWLEIGKMESVARFYIDKSIGHRQELAYALYFDTGTGEIARVLHKADWPRGSQAWGTSRFLHTGEYYGFIGQTVAGLVSLLCCILVYTGTLLGVRRLMSLRKKH
ncbi:MAG: PepSY-associated TM helix domain-containing protein [Pseudomonadota bacterium]|nr:PepSY-associated TM helix domain-containing protein [Pseudomonadota bacterium]